MIKLRKLVPEHIREAADMPPVKFIQKPEHHSYAKAAGDGAGKQYFQGNVDFSNKSSEGSTVAKAANIIKRFENSQSNPHGGYNKQSKRWFPHKSLEGGAGTIAYGHKILPDEDFSSGITESAAEDLLQKDIEKKITLLKSKISNFEALPMTIKIAAINAVYRGDLGPKTMSLLAQSQFDKAAKEYLNHSEYRTTKNPGVKKRMEWNAKVFQGAV